MKCGWGFILSTILMIMSMHSDQIFGMPTAQCDPSLLDEVPPRIRKVCITLSTIYELGTAMENYINNKGLSENDDQRCGYRVQMESNFPILRENSLSASDLKRADGDHVFLRFGRRR